MTENKFDLHIMISLQMKEVSISLMFRWKILILIEW